MGGPASKSARGSHRPRPPGYLMQCCFWVRWRGPRTCMHPGPWGRDSRFSLAAFAPCTQAQGTGDGGWTGCTRTLLNLVEATIDRAGGSWSGVLMENLSSAGTPQGERGLQYRSQAICCLWERFWFMDYPIRTIPIRAIVINFKSQENFEFLWETDIAFTWQFIKRALSLLTKPVI